MLRRNNYVWSQLPLVRYVILYLVGIILGVTAMFHSPWPYFALALLLALVSIIPIKLGDALRSSALSLAALCLGVGYSVSAYEANIPEPLPEERSYWMGEIVDGVVEKPKSYQVIAEVKVHTEAQEGSSKVLLYIAKDEHSASLSYGDQVFFQAAFKAVSAPKNPFQFDYASYLRKKGIAYSAYVPNNSWRLIEKGRGIMAFIHSLQLQLRMQLLEEIWSSEVKAVVNALLLGYKHDLEFDQRAAFANAGAMHVLAVSGLHVGILYLLMMQFLRLLKGKLAKWFRGMVLIALIWSFAILTGLSSSVVRACTMLSFVAISELLGRDSDVFNAIAASAILLLTIDPLWATDLGFQLSYSALLGIVLLQPIFSSFWLPSYSVLRWFWDLITVSTAAQLATFPISIYYFHQFSNYFLLSNIWVIPLVSEILPVGLLVLLTSSIEIIGGVFSKLLEGLVELLLWGVYRIDGLPGSVIEGIHLSLMEVYLLFLIISSCLLYFLLRNYTWLIVALSSLILFSGISLMHQWEAEHQQALVFYQGNASSSLSLINGTLAKVISSGSSDLKRDGIKDHLEQLRVSDEIDASSLRFSADSSLLAWNQWRIYRWDGLDALPKQLRCDVLWVTGGKEDDIAQALQCVNSTYVVVAMPDSREVDLQALNSLAPGRTFINLQQIGWYSIDLKG